MTCDAWYAAEAVDLRAQKLASSSTGTSGMSLSGYSPSTSAKKRMLSQIFSPAVLLRNLPMRISFPSKARVKLQFALKSGQVTQPPLNQKKRPTAYAASAFALPEGSVAFSQVKEQPLCQSVRALMSAKITVTSDRTVCFA
jgi:hypothetical protein